MALKDLFKFRKNESADFGIDQALSGTGRFILPDGTYNVRLSGKAWYKLINPFHWITSCSWPRYWLSVILFYSSVNLIFAIFYYLLGPEHISGIPSGSQAIKFLYCFFFSNQTFTTVGYGGMHPTGISTSIVASVEAFMGVMGFALATGTLYGRFSRPRPKIIFSDHLLISPFKDKTALMFMAANSINTVLMEVEATVNMAWNDLSESPPKRRFITLPLDISKITMFPTNWVIVHPINESSPLLGLSHENLLTVEAQFFVLIKAFDEAFSQTVYAKRSYIPSEVKTGYKFIRPFHTDIKTGQVIMDLSKINVLEKL